MWLAAAGVRIVNAPHFLFLNIEMNIEVLNQVWRSFARVTIRKTTAE